MTKNEFLDLLRQNISYLPTPEIEKSVTFYAESIDDRMEDGMSEEDAVEDLGDIRKIVESIEYGTSVPTLVKAKIKTSRDNSSNKTLWMVLAFCGFPFWLPMVIALSAVILSIYVTIWSLIISMYAVLTSFALAGVVGFFFGLVSFFTIGIPSGFMTTGMSIVCLGLLALGVQPVIWISKKLIFFTSWFILKVKGLFISRNEVTI